MKKMLLFLILPLFMCASMSLAQTLTVGTYGVTPRDVEKDSVAKYFDRAYNSLQNVGNETKVYLKASISTKFASPVWSITSRPGGSVATFGATKNLDTSNQVISFIPDKVGTYKITVTDGALSATVTINSSLFVGTQVGACYVCHNGAFRPVGVPLYSKWSQTGHATMLERGLNGTLSDHYGESCISCHTTGYDKLANNNGFDDYPFTFPDTLMPGMYDSMKTAYPQAMALANIQCESCHGPGADHYGAITDSKMVKSLDADNCAWCHDEGTHHFIPESASFSRHSNPTTLARGSSADCAPCHSGSGFVSWIKGGKAELTTAPAVAKISCGVCHDPHDATNINQLRTVTATFQNGVTVTTGQKGALCMNCHQARRDAVEYTNDYLNNLSSHYGPHHGPQGDMLAGTNGITFGWRTTSSPHLAATKDACVDCHMAATNSESKVGGHTLNMVDPVSGVDNVAACAPCHGTIGTEFSDKKFYVNGNADLDGDGTANGLQVEMEGLLHKLALLLPPKGSTDVSINDSTVTLLEAQAGYNYLFVEEDRSLGIHNPAYAYSLIASSIVKLDPTTDIKLIDNSLPQTFSIDQNYPNPFNPTTTIKYTIPKESNVKLEIYDITGRLVNTVVNQSQSAGTYSVTWDGSNSSGQKVGSGMYLYRINAGSFIAVKKMILLK
ncbi:MAG TPA: ammonia-forming cytochrome c nitrite reductase subunit c552 [Ignavibacteriaceae bacterium]|nr:ammonia-forming cytochrome c nitrite reductase subunit c552 [Ignavibacteriaceae bacterium]